MKQSSKNFQHKNFVEKALELTSLSKLLDKSHLSWSKAPVHTHGEKH